MNLFEKFDELINSQVVGQIANAANDTSGNTDKALKGIYYTLIAGLIRRSNSTMGASMLFNQIQSGGEGGELIKKLTSDNLKTADYKAAINKGSKLLSQIFPAFKSPLVSMIGTYADIPKVATSDYSNLVSALVVDILDEEVKNEKYNADGLTNFLREHHQQLFTNSPEGLLDVMIPALGLQELKNVRFTPPKKGAQLHNSEEQLEEVISHMQPERNYDELTQKKGFPVIPVVAGVAVAALIGAGAWWYFTQRQPAEEAITTEVPAENIVADSLSTKPDSLSTAVDSTISEASGNFSTFGEGLVNYLIDSSQVAGKVFAMDNVVFVAGTANIDPESTLIVDELAELMATYPRLQVRVQGLDAAGNKTVAAKRAYAVKRELLNRGADNNRIDAVGLLEKGKNSVSIKVLTK